MAEFRSSDVIYHLRDINSQMVDAWRELFSEHSSTIKVSEGDVFRDAPSVDAIVSPANSFGFMDGGIDYVYTKHFGQQLQDRLQKVIREKHKGELLVGQAIIVPTYGPEGRDETVDWSKFNEGVPIKYLISAPTMRVPLNVTDTVNAYLAFRAVILAVTEHNSRDDVEPIKEVMVTGLGTAVGKMPKARCAYQMLQAYETFALGQHTQCIHPENLIKVYSDHLQLCEYETSK